MVPIRSVVEISMIGRAGGAGSESGLRRSSAFLELVVCS